MPEKQTKTTNNSTSVLYETVARMDERIRQMSGDIKELKENIPNWSKTNYVLFGTDGKGGLIQEVADIRSIVSDLKDWKIALTAKIAIISAIVGGAFSLIVKVFFN